MPDRRKSLRTKTPVDQHAQAEQPDHPTTSRSSRLLPLALLLCTEGTLLLIGATLPLYGLWFHTSSLNDLFSWLLQPTLHLFPGRPLNPTLLHFYQASPPPIGLSWQ